MKLPSAYEPADYESKMYALWERKGIFTANPNSDKEHFSISMPPPNETGSLHAGHAIFLTLQDLLARHARQAGSDVLWLPGTDHAALAVNALVEKQLTEQGTDKKQLGREKFLHHTRAFVKANRGTMTAQIRAMGASVDWGRARYTLDDTLSRCVAEVFTRMYNDGLIYRGNRIVNWDPNLGTTVSDDEVIHKEEKAPLYTLQFGPFQISTARPETKFGDKYVVMHPDDVRYKKFRDGETFEAEWINGKITATVVKDEAVDPKFGTGVMTITPWHDHTDFEIAQKHALEGEQIIDFSGNLLPVAGEFAGMHITEARPKIVEKLKNKGLLIDVNEKYVHNVALNDRGKGVIEPQIKLQWFIDVNRPAVGWKGQTRSLKEVMRAVIDDEDIVIVPERFKKTYFHWIDNLRDWNISRQLWWGHQLPVWYKGDATYVGVQPPTEPGWEQDDDTLDTWFSSALWTWSTLVDEKLASDYSLNLEDLLAGSQDFQTYHPTSIMETGWDILFFWVARMILATTYTMSSTAQPEDKRVPFRKVYLHGLVRAESGKKMSKSDPEGNVDPLEVIGEFGADALRLALISGAGAGADQRLGKGRVAASRNFCNKLWNVARYIENEVKKPLPLEPRTAADHWILNKLSIATKEVNSDINNFRFNEAYDSLYHFIWDDLADWYIEASKTSKNPSVLAHVLKDSLLLAHPFMPFVTEAIWQTLAWEDEPLAALTSTKSAAFDKNQAQEFEQLKLIISEARRVKAVTGELKPTLIYDDELTGKNETLIQKLAGLAELVKGSEGQGIKLVMTGRNIWIAADKAVSERYIASLKDKQAELKLAVERLKMRLGSKQYTANAPAELVIETKAQLTSQAELLSNVKKELAALKG